MDSAADKKMSEQGGAHAVAAGKLAACASTCGRGGLHPPR
ncbi:UNVERIFIED_ORG: hypothetical protein J2Y81_001498 [Paraburkholderia sediminicola]|nr:hypothetical protein [Paraburkholderia sediminicola]